jgi:hypothetical protein
MPICGTMSIQRTRYGSFNSTGGIGLQPLLTLQATDETA